jgi:hypothetical protein
VPQANVLRRNPGFERLSLVLPLSILILTMVAGLALAGNPATTPVCDLKGDLDGNCTVDTPPQGDLVTVEGIVLAWKQYGVRGPGAILDPVSKCCISVFDIDLAPDLPLGEHILVQGWVSNFAGLMEITDNPADGTMDPVITDLGFFGEIDPMEVGSGLLADLSPFAELEESCLLSVCGTFDTTDTVFGSGVNYAFLGTDGKSCIVRIDNDTDLVGQPIGYQLLPRSTADVEEGKCKPVGTDIKSWSSIKSRFGGDE